MVTREAYQLICAAVKGIIIGAFTAALPSESFNEGGCDERIVSHLAREFPQFISQLSVNMTFFDDSFDAGKVVPSTSDV